MAEQSGAIDHVKNEPVDTPYAGRLHALAEDAGLRNIPSYERLVREFVNAHLRSIMSETVDPTQLDTEYDLSVSQIQAIIDINPDRVVDLMADQINKLPFTTKKTPKPINPDNLLRLVVASHEKGSTGTFPWIRHQQLVGGFRGSSADGFATADDRALRVQRLVMNKEVPQQPQTAPVKIVGR